MTATVWGSQSFSARPADASLDNGSSLWKAISSEFSAGGRLFGYARGSFAPRMWEQYAATDERNVATDIGIPAHRGNDKIPL